jgi:Mrp family chromosome partitioning ATPase
MLRRGDAIEASEIVNSAFIRRRSEQRVALRAQLAEQYSTLLDNHPRIKELKAQISDYDRQLRAEAEKLVRTLENDAKEAAERVTKLGTELDTLKRQAATSNEDDVRLRAFERDAKSKRDLLESYLGKYRETSARESIGSAPADARVISRAIVSNTPFFPKKMPMVLVATFATLAVFAGLVTAGELLRAAPEEVTARPEPARIDPSRWEPARAPAAVVAAPRPAPEPAGPALAAPSGGPTGLARRLFGRALPAITSRVPRPSRTEPDAPPAAPTALAEAPDAAAHSETYAAEVPAAPAAPSAAADESTALTLSSVDELARRLRDGDLGRQVAIFGTAPDGRTTQAAVAVARLLARDSLVVLVRLGAEPAGSTAPAIGGDGPGVTDMIRGEATFGEIIARDKVSRAHIVPRGRGEADTGALLASLRFVTMIDALARTYDHVIVDVGSFDAVSPDQIAELAPAGVLVVPETSDPIAGVARMRLASSGYGEDLIVLAGAPLVAPTPQPEAA